MNTIYHIDSWKVRHERKMRIQRIKTLIRWSGVIVFFAVWVLFIMWLWVA